MAQGNDCLYSTVKDNIIQCIPSRRQGEHVSECVRACVRACMHACKTADIYIHVIEVTLSEVTLLWGLSGIVLPL